MTGGLPIHFFLEEGGEQLECMLFYCSLRVTLQLEGQSGFDLKAH